MCSFCFTRFPFRSEESFIIFSLAKQEKQRKRTEFRCARRALKIIKEEDN